MAAAAAFIVFSAGGGGGGVGKLAAGALNMATGPLVTQWHNTCSHLLA